MKKKLATVAVAASVKLDLGCGKNKQPGFIGVDSRKFDGVDQVAELTEKWPWADDSVDEIHSSHFVEHLTGEQRVHFVNELYRVLKLGCSARIVTPHWAAARAYGDFTHQWPPVSEFWFWYLDKNWRAVNAPHTDFEWNPKGYKCDFEFVTANGMHQAILPRADEYRNYAMLFYKEAIQVLHATLKKR